MGFIQTAIIFLLSIAGFSHALKSCYVGQANVTGSLKDLSPAQLANLSSSFVAKPGNYTVCVAFSLTTDRTFGYKAENQSNITTNLILDGSSTGDQAECLEFGQSLNMSFSVNEGGTVFTPTFKCCNDTENCNKQSIFGALSSSSPERITPSLLLSSVSFIFILAALFSI